jgi:hypothetical protein
MNKIIDYTVVSARNSGALVDAVFDLIEDGWQPLGGVCLAYERNIHRDIGLGDVNLPNDFEHYAQALVKYEMFPGSSALENG